MIRIQWISQSGINASAVDNPLLNLFSFGRHFRISPAGHLGRDGLRICPVGLLILFSRAASVTSLPTPFLRRKPSYWKIVQQSEKHEIICCNKVLELRWLIKTRWKCEACLVRRDLVRHSGGHWHEYVVQLVFTWYKTEVINILETDKKSQVFSENFCSPRLATQEE